eukprot:SAG31_NODE_1078_length_10032_cov_4.602034_8_plen_138_part_00
MPFNRRWSAKISRSTGEIYFVNNETGESTWQPPTVSGTENSSELWKARTSKTTGETYHFNTKTGATQWEAPGVASGEDAVSSPEAQLELFNQADKGGKGMLDVDDLAALVKSLGRRFVASCISIVIHFVLPFERINC